MKCQVCSSEIEHEVIDLGHHPPSDLFLSEKDLAAEEVFYPLKVVFCEACKLVQLSHIVDPKKLFGEHFIYRTGFNNQLKKHFKESADYLIKEFGLKEGDFVVDIGSNDGTVLSFYPQGIRVLGIDPSSVADIAIAAGIPTIKDFFNENLARTILEKHGEAKIVTCTNTFAHLKDLSSVVNGVKTLIGNKGIFLQESHYLLDMVQKLQYSEIYLEHLRYYSLESLVNLFNRFGMDVFHAESIDTHGGSIRTFACKKGAYPISDSVKILLGEERKFNLNSKQTFEAFRERVRKNREKIMALLYKIKSEGHRIVGISAPAKGNTLLNFCRIGPELLDYTVERSDLKIGKFTPGMHIKVEDEALMFKDQPEYAFLLSWDIKDIIVPKLKAAGYKGKIIVPIPEPEVL